MRKISQRNISQLIDDDKKMSIKWIRGHPDPYMGGEGSGVGSVFTLPNLLKLLW